MRYALLSYAEPGAWDALSDEERAAWVADDAEWNAILTDRDALVTGFGLVGAGSATTVRVTGGEVALTDGPFAETTEHLGGVAVIDATDLDAALELARRCPAARLGPLEVRPVRH